MKNEVAYKNQNVYLKINVYVNQTSTLHFRPVLSLYRNQSTDTQSKSMGQFLYNDNTGLKYANPNHQLFHTLFFSLHEENLFPHVSKLTRHTFDKGIKRRMQTKNLANNSHKQFYFLLKTNQIKLHTYPDLLKENP